MRNEIKSIITAMLIFVVIFGVSFYLLTGGYTRLKLAFFPKKATDTELRQELMDRTFGISPFWLERYGLSVSDPSDLEKDGDDDGLTLLEEFEYNTDPLHEDTDRDGYTDGQEVDNNYSPTGNGRFDANSNGLPDTWEEEFGVPEDQSEQADDPDNDQLSNIDELRYGTNPMVADTDGDGFSDGQETKNGYDPAAPGEAQPEIQIVINKIGVDAPVVLSQSEDEEDLQKDLEQGVILYPGMARPGKRGNAYIAGHSSNFIWSKGQYNDIFKDLVGVVPGDKIIVKEILASGKTVTHPYTVTLQEEVAPDEPQIFAEATHPQLTLTTCWPLGTRERRIMVKASLDADSAREIYAEDRIAARAAEKTSS